MKNVLFTLPSKLSIFIIDHAESFFFLSLTHFFITATLHIFNWPCTSQKNSMLAPKLIFQNKGLNDPIWVGRHTKKQSKVVQVWFKETLLVYHSAIMSTKWQNVKATPTLILFEDISIKIIGRGLLYS